MRIDVSAARFRHTAWLWFLMLEARNFHARRCRRGPLPFLERVKRLAQKHGIELTTIELDATSTQLVFKRPYGPTRGLLVTDVTESGCLGETGAPYCVADVVQRMRQRLEQRKDDQP